MQMLCKGCTLCYAVLKTFSYIVFLTNKVLSYMFCQKFWSYSICKVNEHHAQCEEYKPEGIVVI